MRSTLLYKGWTESLRGVDPTRIHRMRSTLVYKRCGEWLDKGCGEFLEGVDPSMIHHMRSALVVQGVR